MPRRKPKTFRRRRRRRTTRRRKSSIPYLITSRILPRQSVMCVHRYTDRMYYNADLQSYNSCAFNLNSIFDPDLAVTNLSGNRNAQPRYRDEVAALYGTYRVKAAKFTFTVQNSGVVAGDRCEYVVYKRGINSNDQIPTSNQGILQEHPGRVGGTVLGLGRGGTATHTTTGWWSEKELNALNRLQNQALSGANPANMPSVVCAVVGGASGDDVDNIVINIRIDYYVLWTQGQYADVS